MDSNNKLPELLSPCGSPEALEGAINGGADAVYLGGSIANARMRAKNFDKDALIQAVKLCHKNGVKLYTTVNTLALDRECDELVRYVGFLYEIGVDALIIADIGLAVKIRQLFPDFELHASTQMSAHNAEGVRFLAENGFSRVVVARELSEENISKIVKGTAAEIEMFIHGALCVCHSGQCLCSWAMGGRSGNRGMCAQSCRMKYNGGYPLSLKDNCLAAYIPQIINSGVASLKIEGRMKNADYVYGVTRVYRRLIDEKRSATENELDYLAGLFSRQGFTDGYYTSHISSSMCGVHIDGADKPKPIKLPAFENKKAVINTVRVGSELPANKINFDRIASPKIICKSALFLKPENVPAMAEAFFDRIYLPLECYKKINSKCTGIVLPAVITDDMWETTIRKMQVCRENGAEHCLIGNLGQLKKAKELGFVIHGSWRLNITNRSSAAFYSQYLSDFILSPELTLPQIKDITGAKAVIVYGRLPLMLLEKKPDARILNDTRGESFPLIQLGGRTEMLNSIPLYMADRDGELKEAYANNRFWLFTLENRREVCDIIEKYKNGTPPEKSMKFRRILAK